MGSGANVNAFFGIMTTIISIPTGVKLFNWLFTMYRGRIRFHSATLWTIGFMITFAVGGMTGVLLAVPGADFVLHNTLFLVAHFHNVIIGGVVFGCLAGMSFWFPKVFGFTLNEFWGKVSFWCWLIGFYLAFTPLYILGFMGMTRRMNHYDNPDWQPYLIVALVGAVHHRRGHRRDHHPAGREHPGPREEPRPDRRSVGCAQPGMVHRLAGALLQLRPCPADHLARAALGGQADGPRLECSRPHYEDIHMPKNTGAGFVMAVFGFVLCFALVWHMWLIAVARPGGHDRDVRRAHLQPGRRLLRARPAEVERASEAERYAHPAEGGLSP